MACKLKRTLKAEPKLYLFDIIPVTDPGARLENLAALHLLKSCQFWTDAAYGEFDLRYVRDNEKREVDFCILNGGRPWMLVECKSGDTAVSPALPRFAAALKTRHNFQLVDKPGYRRDYPALNVTVVDYERFFSGFV